MRNFCLLSLLLVGCATVGPPSRGPARARVTIFEWADYQCPFSAAAAPVVEQLADAFPDVKFIFKQLPLPNHKSAHLAAEAALAAQAQGKFWPMHRLLFASSSSLDRASIDGFAAQIGLDVRRFDADLDSGRWRAQVDADMAEARRRGIHATPSFLVDGQLQVGAPPLEDFKAQVAARLTARR